MSKNLCPSCGSENIEGLDQCEQCGQSITVLSKPRPSNAVEKSIVRDRISALSPRAATFVTPDTSVAKVLDVLAESGHGVVVVVEDGLPVGIFSERDALMRLNLESQEFSDHPIREFMTPNPATLNEDDRIAFALNKMAGGGYRHVPIVDDDGRVTGIVSVRDILRYAVQSLVHLEGV